MTLLHGPPYSVSASASPSSTESSFIGFIAPKSIAKRAQADNKEVQTERDKRERQDALGRGSSSGRAPPAADAANASELRA